MATVRNIFTNFVIKFMVDFVATADVEKIVRSCKKENMHMLFHCIEYDVNYVIIFEPSKIL